MSIGERFLFFKVRWFLFKEAREVRRRFPFFKGYERAFRRAYRFANPFRICRAYSEENIYGETPLPAFAQIAKLCDLKSDDILLELGCGRGRGALFLNQLIGCRVMGIDCVPFFIHTAQNIAASLQNVSFRCEDMLKTDFSQATAIYLYGTCLSDETILSLIERFKALPSSVKIITVSYALIDYSPEFYTSKQFSVMFPWGEGDVYLNLRRSHG